MMEFDLIDAIRARAGRRRGDVALGIGDDAALLEVPAGRRLVACTDTMVAGVHFLAGTTAEDLGWKSLAVNLSDLAAMGADPAWALLSLTLPEANGGFVDRFAEGFVELATAHGVALVGGDTTQGPLSITVTALGTVPHGGALMRGGARAGDAVFVTGTLGDAAAALRLLRDSGESHPPRSPYLRKGEDRLDPLPQEGRPEAPGALRGRAAAGGCSADSGKPVHPDAFAGLLARMHRPEPRISAGQVLRGVASACIDVSDGLLADLAHVCTASGVAAEVDVEALPVSAALRSAFDAPACRGFALAGGDDYELCFTAPPDRGAEIAGAFERLGLRLSRIGRIGTGEGVRVLDAEGNPIDTLPAGWQHFATSRAGSE